MSDVKAIPDSSSALIPMLVCRDVSAEIDFCTATFGAAELGRRPGPDGVVVHALLAISGAMVIIEGSGLHSRAARPGRTAARRWWSSSMSRTLTL